MLTHSANEVLPAERLAALEEIQRRVLWIATAMIDYANNRREQRDGSKVGGHQASSASIVSILTALYFEFLRPGDRVSVKPHASPAYHAVQYLLGNLPREYLTRLRDFHGLQAYPSRTKDPDPVDFSTGSVGLGAVAPAFAALAHRYAKLHFGEVTSNRFISILGDAELDEGNVWEAVAEGHLSGLGNVLWIVDLNRQSLDRVVPGIRAAQLKSLFRDARWHVVEAKYGRRLQAIYARPGGETLRRRIDEMSNEEYQMLLRRDGPTIREKLIAGAGSDAGTLERVLADVPDADLLTLIGDLGGHDIAELLSTFQAADAVTDAPSVVFAYTIKGWGLPIAGDPLNHSIILSPERLAQVRRQYGIPETDEWAQFPPDSPAGRLCREAADRLKAPTAPPAPPVPVEQVPAQISVPDLPVTSSQEAFGRLLAELFRVEGLGPRIVTTSPDVAISTNLAGWINRAGVFESTAQIDYGPEGPRLIRWQPGPTGQHIELGISEMNLFMLLGQLGLSFELCGQHLIPIGTVYDPFICRGLDAFIYSLYSGSKMIVVGTPSGVSLSPEGGAHQSSVTPSLGIELPNLDFYEPCFAREVEWTLLEAIRQCCDREAGLSSYLRLSTKPIDQSLLTPALEHYGEAGLREQVLAGGYRLIEWREVAPNLDPRDMVQIIATGTMVPEAVAAAQALHREGVAANVLTVTSASRLYRGFHAVRRRQLREGRFGDEIGRLGRLVPPGERHAPIVTVQDGASHALAFLGSAFGTRVIPLGVDEFGQSGSRPDLYAEMGIDSNCIVEAAYTALELVAGDA